MFERILFPTDFSKDRNSALGRAFQALQFNEREVIVLHVVNNFFGPHAHWASLFDVHQLQKKMDFHVETEIKAELRDDMKRVTSFRPIILQGKPPEEICRLASQEMVDLVVMGSTRGVTTMRVIRSATRPVLAIPIHLASSKAAESIQRKQTRPYFGHSPSILVATDFSRQAKKVTDYAFEIKKAFDWPIHLVYAVKTPTMLHSLLQPSEVASSLDEPRKWAKMQALNVIPTEFISDESVHVRVELGPTSECILNAAKQIAPTIIVMGAKGYGPVENYFYGTTVDRVLRHAIDPVLTLTL